MSDLPLKATLKAGKDYDAPWLTVDAHDPADLELKLKAIASGGAPQALIEAANALKAANRAAPLLAHSEPVQAPAPQAASPQQNSGWGQQQNVAPAQPAQPAPQQQLPPQEQGWQRPATAHPEGLACHCGKGLEYGKTRTNKGQWKCPDYRYNAGNPNDHRLEWA